MKKHAFFLATLLSFSLVFSACSSESAKKTSGTQSNTGEISINGLDLLIPSEYGSVEGLKIDPASTLSLIVPDVEDAYWATFEEGANQAIKDLNTLLGYKDDDKISLSYCAPREKDDVDDQVSLLDEELARFPIAVGIVPIDEYAFGVQFDLAKEDGIPIVTIHAGHVNQNMTAHIATDHVVSSKMVATELVNTIGQSGEILLFSKDSSIDAQNKTRGFVTAIKTLAPDIIVSTYTLEDMPSAEDAKAKIATTLEQKTNTKAIYATDAHTTQLISSVLTSEQKESLTIIGFDGGKTQMNLLKKGDVDGLILQNPYGMGYATIVSMVRASMGMPTESFIDSGSVWVTQENKDSAAIKNFIY